MSRQPHTLFSTWTHTLNVSNVHHWVRIPHCAINEHGCAHIHILSHALSRKALLGWSGLLTIKGTVYSKIGNTFFPEVMTRLLKIIRRPQITVRKEVGNYSWRRGLLSKIANIAAPLRRMPCLNSVPSQALARYPWVSAHFLLHDAFFNNGLMISVKRHYCWLYSDVFLLVPSSSLILERWPTCLQLIPPKLCNPQRRNHQHLLFKDW